jgi:hypothetical protein
MKRLLDQGGYLTITVPHTDTGAGARIGFQPKMRDESPDRAISRGSIRGSVLSKSHVI